MKRRQKKDKKKQVGEELIGIDVKQYADGYPVGILREINRR